MMAADKPVLVDEKLALSLFLDSLLREPQPEAEENTAAPALAEAAPAAVLSEPVIADPVITAELEQAEPVAAPVEEEPVQEEAGAEFQIMLFKVAGLSLAVPLEGLSGVVEWQDNLAEMPGHADFYLGILQHLGRRIPVVETASLVFPPERLAALDVPPPRERITRIVLIDEGRWGLAVDSVEEVITLRREQVRWRSERTKRKWLLGTVIEHMCALIDPRAFAEKLASGED